MLCQPSSLTGSPWCGLGGRAFIDSVAGGSSWMEEVELVVVVWERCLALNRAGIRRLKMEDVCVCVCLLIAWACPTLCLTSGAILRHPVMLRPLYRRNMHEAPPISPDITSPVLPFDLATSWVTGVGGLLLTTDCSPDLLQDEPAGIDDKSHHFKPMVFSSCQYLNFKY